MSVVDDFWVHVLNLPLEKLYNDFSFSIVHPDIIKREITQERGRPVITITVIDVKATGKAMLFHRAQVAFYTLLVEGLIRYWTRRGIIDKERCWYVSITLAPFGTWMTMQMRWRMAPTWKTIFDYNPGIW